MSASQTRQQTQAHSSRVCRKRDHEYIVAFKCRKRQQTKRCTEERVTITKSGSYFRLCYKKKQKEMPAKQKRFECKVQLRVVGHVIVGM